MALKGCMSANSKNVALIPEILGPEAEKVLPPDLDLVLGIVKVLANFFF